eukprot:TRINITY_DN8636_c0_g1_i2.p1 TRINITY_DN8636_c0_g1~~TRINITY_DN8636_c0_g1_i2.p1  ORF type:complete len:509 (+),score=126.90 TRINITY_DN8636_c0_g1_i2:97-1527(+)
MLLVAAVGAAALAAIALGGNSPQRAAPPPSREPPQRERLRADRGAAAESGGRRDSARRRRSRHADAAAEAGTPPAPKRRRRRERAGEETSEGEAPQRHRRRHRAPADTPPGESSGRHKLHHRRAASPSPPGAPEHPFVVAAKEYQREQRMLKVRPKVYPELTPEQRRAAVTVPQVQAAEPAPGLRRAPGDFDPGDLNVPRDQVVARCAVPLQQYRGHLMTGATMTSHKHNVALLMGPKAGSSTSRHLILLFEGRDEGRSGLRRLKDSVWRAWLVREPLSRFYAQYEEMIARSFQKSYGPLPARLRWREGLPTYETYAKLFDDPEGMASLSRRFEAFVTEWDGVYPFDVHLVQQVPSLSGEQGPLRADFVAETREVASVLEQLKTHARPQLADETLLRSTYANDLLFAGGRAFPRRLNVSLVSDAAKRRVCMFAAVDYCCLNWKLPPACAAAPPGQRVRCAYGDGPRQAAKIEPVIA